MRRTALILRLQRLIELTYDLETGVRDIAPFIIGDEGFTRLYAARPLVRVIGSAPRETATTLMREENGALRVCLYYPDRLVENLESHDPTRRLTDENVDDFATLVEELDHFLTIADRHRTGAEISLLELELHANVTKALMLELFVARMRGRLAAAERAWVRHHLFHKIEYREEDSAVRSRYRDAASLAVRYLDHLLAVPAAGRPAELRRFHRRTHHEKLSQIARL
jgi:hypothetical protein